MFGRIFGDKDSKDILKDFIQSILPDLQIDSIEPNKQFYIDKIKPYHKFSRMDIVATINNGIKVNIEIQMNDYKNVISRSLYYEERLGSSDLLEGINYNKIPKAISIWILNFDIFEDGTYHDISRIRRDYNHAITTDKFEIHFIQLPKFKKSCKKISTKLEEWLTFIVNENMEEIKNMDNVNIEKAQTKLETLNSDKEARAYAEYLADAKRNEMSVMIGYRAEGETKKQIQIIKKMLKENMDIKLISKLTDATEEEILKIQKKMKTK